MGVLPPGAWRAAGAAQKPTESPEAVDCSGEPANALRGGACLGNERVEFPARGAADAAAYVYLYVGICSRIVAAMTRTRCARKSAYTTSIGLQNLRSFRAANKQFGE